MEQIPSDVVTSQKRPVEILQILNDLRIGAGELDAGLIKSLFCLLDLALQLVLVVPVSAIPVNMAFAGFAGTTHRMAPHLR